MSGYRDGGESLKLFLWLAGRLFTEYGSICPRVEGLSGFGGGYVMAFPSDEILVCEILSVGA